MWDILKSGEELTATHVVTGNKYNVQYENFVLLLDGVSPINGLDLLKWYNLELKPKKVEITKEQAQLIEMLIVNGKLFPPEKRELATLREQLKPLL